MKYTVRVWKVTEYEVTLEPKPGQELTSMAIALAELGHTTDTVGEIGVIDRGTFPVVKEIRELA